MKANELMIGDYVRFKHGIDKVVGVSWVPGLGDCAWFAASATLFPESVEDVNPIPFTREILEKNGFKKLDFSHYHIQDRTLVLDADGKWDGPLEWHWVVTEMDTNANGQPYVLDWYVATIRFVHELQHALRICGVDKEIVL